MTLRSRWTWACVTLFASLTLFTSFSSALPQQAAGPERTPVLIELFTSEGCSSCPPADQLLRDVIKTQPVANARIIALGEHVDYWNQLGWTDPFSAAMFSQRQSDYGTTTGVDVYTPQLVVDGRRALVGSDRAQAIAAIRAAAARPKAAVRLAWTTAAHRELAVTTTESPSLAEARVLLAIAEDGLRSQVRRGENEGRELAHDAVTRRLTDIGATDRRGSFHRVLPIAPLLEASWQPAALHLVVFVQRGKGDVAAVETIAVR